MLMCPNPGLIYYGMGLDCYNSTRCAMEIKLLKPLMKRKKNSIHIGLMKFMNRSGFIFSYEIFVK